MTHGTPAAEIEIDAARVRALLEAQCPKHAALPIKPFASGWDNAMFRLGGNLLVRLPRRAEGARLMENELRWLPQLPDLPLAHPQLVFQGVPAGGYPWPWSILSWIEGQPSDLAPPDVSEAKVLAKFLKALHQPARPDSWVNPYRGCPLSDRKEATEKRFLALRGKAGAVTRRVEEAWNAGLTAEPGSQRLRLHGDMHAQNILTHHGKLAGVIDWGDTCCGDPASDLLSIWALFESPNARRIALDHYGASPNMEARARGWAVSIALVLLMTGLVDNPRHAKMGEAMLRRVDADR